MTSRVLWSFCFFALLLVSCSPVVSLEKQREARRGLDAALAQLPTLASFTPVKVLVYESYDNEHGGEHVCYYAKGYVIVGSSLPYAKALDVYAHQLQSLGWTFDKAQYTLSRLLSRESNEDAVVYSYEPGPEIREAVDYAQLKKSYESIIVIRIDYTVPNGQDC